MAARSGLGSSPDHGRAQDGEIGVRQHGQRDVAVPAGPGADLVLVEADLAPFGVVQTTLTQQDEHHVRLAVEDLPREPVPGSDAALLADGWITVTGLDPVSHVPLGIVAEVGAG